MTSVSLLVTVPPDSQVTEVHGSPFNKVRCACPRVPSSETPRHSPALPTCDMGVTPRELLCANSIPTPQLTSTHESDGIQREVKGTQNSLGGEGMGLLELQNQSMRRRSGERERERIWRSTLHFLRLSATPS